MDIHKIVVGQLDVNCYIVSDGSAPDAIVIDPGDEPELIAGLIEDKGLRPRHIIFTHAHYDHVCAARDLKDKYKASIVMHEDEIATYEMTKKLCMSWGYEAEDFPFPEIKVRDGHRISAGKISLEIIHTPGHTPGGICIYGKKTLFTGDTLFKGSAGRTDLAGGNAGKLISSLQKLSLLPPDTRVLCGHGDETTIGYETKNNPFLGNRFLMRHHHRDIEK